MCRTCAIITCSLYIFYPNFEDHFFFFKEVFSENYVLMYGQCLRAGYDGASTVFNWNLAAEIHDSCAHSVFPSCENSALQFWNWLLDLVSKIKATQYQVTQFFFLFSQKNVSIRLLYEKVATVWLVLQFCSWCTYFFSLQFACSSVGSLLFLYFIFSWKQMNGEF